MSGGVTGGSCLGWGLAAGGGRIAWVRILQWGVVWGPLKGPFKDSYILSARCTVGLKASCADDFILMNYVSIEQLSSLCWYFSRLIVSHKTD